MNFEVDKENSSLRDGRYLNHSTILMVCVLAAGLFLRLYDLAGESLWFDEGCSIRVAKMSLIEIVFELIQDVHPPLYFFILHYWVGLLGDSEFSARFLSVVFGFSSIIMLYRLGSLLFNKHIGLLSALLLSLSEFHIRYSQEVRGYSLMVFLSLLSMYFFVRLREVREKKTVWGYVLSSSALVYTHNYGLFIIVAQNIYALILYVLKAYMPIRTVAGWWRIQIILAMLYLPWLFILVHQVISIQDGYWIPRPTMETLLNTFTQYSGSVQLSLIFITLIVIGIALYLFPGKKRQFLGGDAARCISHVLPFERMFFLTLWMVIPVLLPFIISHISAPIYVTRYTIAASLPFYIMTAWSVERLPLRHLKFGAIFLLIILSIGNLQGYFMKINKQQWREVASFIDTHAKKNDVVLVSPGYTLANIFNHYSKRSDLHKIPFEPKPDKVHGEDPSNLLSVIEGYDGVWLVTSFYMDGDGFLTTLQNMGYTLECQARYDGSGSLNDWAVIEIHKLHRHVLMRGA